MLQISIREWKWIVASPLSGNNGILYVPLSKLGPWTDSERSFYSCLLCCWGSKGEFLWVVMNIVSCNQISERLFVFLSLLRRATVISSFLQWSSCATVWEKPQKCLGAGAGDVMDSWAWGFAGKPWVSDMDRLQVSMAKAHKQEETLRESRYFTALDHYKHPERGRKPLLMLK